jgi:hypothetical protein
MHRVFTADHHRALYRRRSAHSHHRVSISSSLPCHTHALSPEFTSFALVFALALHLPCVRSPSRLMVLCACRVSRESSRPSLISSSHQFVIHRPTQFHIPHPSAAVASPRCHAAAHSLSMCALRWSSMHAWSALHLRRVPHRRGGWVGRSSQSFHRRRSSAVESQRIAISSPG